MVSISFVGDLCLLNPDEVKLSNEVQTILDKSDFNLINFEVPVKADSETTIHKSGPSLSQSKDAPRWVEDHGWNVVSIANNHILDYGEDSLRLTKSLFHKADVIGGGNFSEAYKVLIKETSSGKKVGFIAGSHREFGVLDNKEDKDRQGCAWVCHPQFVKSVIDARTEVDILIAFIHAGVEEFDQPLPEWKEQYHFLVDLGCDAVVASHPHVPQGWESYKGKPICYSLGNFCFQKPTRSTAPHWYESLICALQFNDDGSCIANMSPLLLEGDEIKLDDSTSAKNHIEELNQILNDKKLYSEYIEQNLPLLWSDYKWLFSLSGLKLNPNFKDGLRTIKRKLLNRECDMTHLLNNLQNESHRWAIERITRIKYGIKY